MSRFLGACNTCCFYFTSRLIKNLLVKVVFNECCLTFPVFQPQVSYRHISYKKKICIVEIQPFDNASVFTVINRV